MSAILFTIFALGRARAARAQSLATTTIATASAALTPALFALAANRQHTQHGRQHLLEQDERDADRREGRPLTEQRCTSRKVHLAAGAP